MADFPDVPNVLGVPQLNFRSGVEAAYALLTGDSGISPSGAAQWGIFKNGRPAVTAESVFSFEYRNESSISDFPVERGAFESYNKVASPYDARIRFIAGSMEQRQSLLEVVERISGDLELYDAVTPEKTFTNVNVVHYDFRRSAASGLGLLAVDVWVREVRLTQSQESAPTAAPSGASPINGGTVQPTAPTAAQTAAAGTAGIYI